METQAAQGGGEIEIPGGDLVDGEGGGGGDFGLEVVGYPAGVVGEEGGLDVAEGGEEGVDVLAGEAVGGLAEVAGEEARGVEVPGLDPV